MIICLNTVWHELPQRRSLFSGRCRSQLRHLYEKLSYTSVLIIDQLIGGYPFLVQIRIWTVHRCEFILEMTDMWSHKNLSCLLRKPNMICCCDQRLSATLISRSQKLFCVCVCVCVYLGGRCWSEQDICTCSHINIHITGSRTKFKFIKFTEGLLL